VLKGALMLSAWQSPYSRPTRDIGLLALMANRIGDVEDAIRVICQEPALEDGLYFDADTVTGAPIMETADYRGLRVRFAGYLESARIPMRIDIGFGDAVVPRPSRVRLPTILDVPAAEVQGYSRESVIAEKVQIMVRLGEANSRMKDFYDVWALASQFGFDGPVLSRAMQAAFARRATELASEPVAFSGRFAEDTEKRTQWAAFLDRLHVDAPHPTLREAVETIATLVQPVMQALEEGTELGLHWQPGGSWAERSRPEET
jgi:hypothetical protein